LWSPASAATIPRTARETLTYGYVYRHPAIRIRKVGVVGIAGRVCSGRCAHTHLLVLFDHPAAIIIPCDVADPPRAHRLVPRARMNELRDRHMRRIVATVTVLGRVADWRDFAAETGGGAGAVSVAVLVQVERRAGVRGALRGDGAHLTVVEEALRSDADLRDGVAARVAGLGRAPRSRHASGPAASGPSANSPASRRSSDSAGSAARARATQCGCAAAAGTARRGASGAAGGLGATGTG